MEEEHTREDPTLLDLSQLQVHSLLGRGGFASCWRAKYAGEDIALKVLQSRVDQSENELCMRMFLKEVVVTSKLKHRYVIKCLGAVELPGGFVPNQPKPALAMALELCEGGTLKEQIARNMDSPRRTYTDRQAYTWLLQIATALAHLHSRKPAVIHRDVKPDNIFLRRCTDAPGGELQCRLADLGLHAELAEERPAMLRCKSNASIASASARGVTLGEAAAAALVGAAGAAAVRRISGLGLGRPSLQRARSGLAGGQQAAGTAGLASGQQSPFFTISVGNSALSSRLPSFARQGAAAAKGFSKDLSAHHMLSGSLHGGEGRRPDAAAHSIGSGRGFVPDNERLASELQTRLTSLQSKRPSSTASSRHAWTEARASAEPPSQDVHIDVQRSAVSAVVDGQRGARTAAATSIGLDGGRGGGGGGDASSRSQTPSAGQLALRTLPPARMPSRLGQLGSGSYTGFEPPSGLGLGALPGSVAAKAELAAAARRSVGGSSDLPKITQGEPLLTSLYAAERDRARWSAGRYGFGRGSFNAVTLRACGGPSSFNTTGPVEPEDVLLEEESLGASTTATLTLNDTVISAVAAGSAAGADAALAAVLCSDPTGGMALVRGAMGPPAEALPSGAPLPPAAHLRSGALPSGTLSYGAHLPPGSHLPAGAPLPAGAHLRSGALPSGTLPYGGPLPSRVHLPSGALPSGALPSGALPSLTLPSGTLLPLAPLPARAPDVAARRAAEEVSLSGLLMKHPGLAEPVSAANPASGLRRAGSLLRELGLAELKPLRRAEMEWVYGLTGRAGSVMYMAPEVFHKLPYNEKSDVFSFAVLAYELLSGDKLASSVFLTGLANKLGLRDPVAYAEHVAGGYRPPRLPRFSDAAWSLITACWHDDPVQRPAMEQVAARLQDILDGKKEGAGEKEEARGKDKGKKGRKEPGCMGCVIS